MLIFLICLKVMTTVYGVTFIGARDQIERQLKDRTDLPEEECWPAASYLAKKVRTITFSVPYVCAYRQSIGTCLHWRFVRWCQGHPNMAQSVRPADIEGHSC